MTRGRVENFPSPHHPVTLQLLPCHQLSKQAILLGELVKATLLHDASVLEDVDTIGLANCTQTVGDRNPGDVQPF